MPPVLAVGGSASVGKTTVATNLAAGRGIPVVHVDDLRHEVLGPGFAATTPDVWRRPVDEIVDIVRAETAQLAPVIDAAVAGLLAAGTGGVVEGEGVEPELMARWAPRDVHTVIVVEDDPIRLHDTFVARPSRDRFLALDAAEQRSVVGANLGYGAWLRSEADRCGVSRSRAHPWPTLPERILGIWLHVP